MVAEEWHATLPVARVAGEVDAGNAGELAVRLRELVTNQSTGLIVDLTETEYLDSAGINLLFTIGDELIARQQRLRVVIPAESPISRLLAITGMDRVHAVHGTVAEALAA